MKIKISFISLLIVMTIALTGCGDLIIGSNVVTSLWSDGDSTVSQSIEYTVAVDNSTSTTSTSTPQTAVRKDTGIGSLVGFVGLMIFLIAAYIYMRPRVDEEKYVE